MVRIELVEDGKLLFGQRIIRCAGCFDGGLALQCDGADSFDQILGIFSCISILQFFLDLASLCDSRVEFFLRGKRVAEHIPINIEICFVVPQQLVAVDLTQFCDHDGQFGLVAAVSGDAGLAPCGVIRIQVSTVAPDRKLPAHDFAVRQSPVRSANAGEGRIACHAIRDGVHPAGLFAIVKLTEVFAILITFLGNFAGRGLFNVFRDFGLALIRPIYLRQIETVRFGARHHVGIRRIDVRFADVIDGRTFQIHLVSLFDRLLDEIGDHIAGLRVLVHRNDGRINVVAEAERLRVQRDDNVDLACAVGLDRTHRLQCLVELGDDIVLDVLAVGGGGFIDRLDAVLIRLLELCPVFFGVVRLAVLLVLAFQAFQCALAVVGQRVVDLAGVNPLGIERDVLCGEYRVIARPGGLAFGVIAPAAEHIAVARGGRLDADRDLTVDLTRDRFRTVQCAAVGVKGDCGRCSL